MYHILVIFWAEIGGSSNAELLETEYLFENCDPLTANTLEYNHGILYFIGIIMIHSLSTSSSSFTSVTCMSVDEG